VIQLQAEVLLRLVIEVEERERPLLRHSQSIEHMIAAVDSEVRFNSTSLFERHVGTGNAVELRLKMSVGKKQERERLLRRAVWRRCCE